MSMNVTASFLIPLISHRSEPLQSNSAKQAGMRPSSNMSFEPGLERGVPWGRDLFTFVTSAAGHMMRTLQKPRKNKPSKRQVNHRRFLHNMIQRKFAEIEAANQQLATALFSADTSQSHLKPKSHNHTIESLKNTEKASANSCETKTLSKQQDEVNDYRTLKSAVVNPDTTFFKSKALNILNSGEDSHPWESVEVFEHSQENSPRRSSDFNCEREQNQSPAADLDNLTQVTNMILEDSVFTWLESIERIRHNKSSEADITESADVAQDQPYLGITLFDMSLISPAVSPLSLDSLSCDFEEQMHPESEHSSEVQQITESLEMDVMENLELLAASEEYLQGHHNDQMNVASSVWNIQSEENRSHFQGSLTFLNTSPEGYVIDNPTEADCAGGVIPKGLEPEPLIDTEYDLISYSACSLAPCEYAAREKEQTKDCYLSQLDISTSLNEQNDTWGASKTALKGFEQRDFTNHTLDSQALQKPAHASSNQTSSIHRNQQHPTHKDHTQIITTDPYYDLSGAEKNRSIETGPSLNPNSVYTSPPNPLSSSTSHCYSFEDQRQDNSTYRGDFCSYSVDESDVSIPSFEGVAQSFPAPVNKPHPYSISTPLLNDDWLFSNIVAEQDFNSMVRSQGCAHC